MKLLQDILFKVDLLEVAGSTNLAITNVCFDSRKVTKDSLFVAIKGTQTDGHNFIEKAIELGAAAILAQELPATKPDHITFVKVNDSSKSLSIIASNFYNNPSESLNLVAVTGTNGKTSVATMLYNFYQSRGQKSGLISTIVNKVGFNDIDSTHTTPDALQINYLLSLMVEQGCTYCFMEASSHAIHQNRIFGLQFNGAIFTNISHDHLDYHKTFDDYILAKKQLFDQLSADSFALVNKDDKHGLNMLHHCKAKQYTYGIKTMTDFKAKILETQFAGQLMNIDGKEVWSRIVGEFNAYNLLAIYATAILLGEDHLQALTSISALNSPPGRFDVFESQTGIVGIVDYAHTPNAISNVLKTILELRNENQSVITIVGCGGDRDTSKRSKMGKISTDLSDKVVFTSDNPRTEIPAKIIEQIQEGVEENNKHKYLSISDRKEAIKTACSIAKPGDIILLAGKGHEKYQEINGERFPFDDKLELKTAFNLLKK
ncbi:MAG: UDP-N-acetylmuramoyl-L-alanyl-D-glutamate--2,6-diaminopimelate ligase [Flavobacteriales bacterium]